MEITIPAYIGKNVTIKVIRDYILDSDITDDDTFVLNPSDYAEIASEYGDFYKQDLQQPYLLLGVLIEKDQLCRISKGQALVIRNDTQATRTAYEETFAPNEVVHRCGICGSIINEDGSQPTPNECQRKVNYLNKFGLRANVQHTYGYCCPNGVPPKFTNVEN